MNRHMNLHNENGSALVIVVLILAVVTVLGVLATRTATIELQVASHDKLHKMVWYATESACDGLAPEMLEKNIEERGFGSAATPFAYGPTSANLWILNSAFWQNDTCNVGGDIQMYSLNETDITTAVFGGNTEFNWGSAIQLPEGYHGRGKGLAGGGAQIRYTISALGQGPARSRARVATGWRHVI